MLTVLTVLPAMHIRHTWILCMIFLFSLIRTMRPANAVMSPWDRYEDYHNDEDHEVRMPDNSNNEEEDED